MLIVGILKLGASVKPLDELPSTTSTCFKADKYLNWPKEIKAHALSGCFATYSSISLIIILPLVSALGFVKIKLVFFCSDIASRRFRKCFSAVLFSRVTG